MTLKSVGSDNQFWLTAQEKIQLKGPLAELGLTNTKQLGGAQIGAALALSVAETIPGESARLREALARYNQTN